MKIKSLAIENLRWHRSFSLQDIPWLTLITGPNACGKTSILEALTWALCGATRHTSIDGKGADVLVMDGEGRALVEVDVTDDRSGDHTIKRSIPHSLSVDGTCNGIKRTTELLKAVMDPITPEALLICFESTRILHMNDQERKKFLGSVIGINRLLNVDEVNTLVRSWLPTVGISTTESVTTNISGILNSTFSTYLFGATFSDLYKIFYEKRRALSASIKTAEGLSVIETTTEELPDHTVLARRKVMLEAELALSIAREVKPEDSVGAVLIKPDIDKIEGKLKNLESIVNKTNEALIPLKARITIQESQLNQIGSAAKQCPFFAKVCPIPAEEVDSAIESVKHNLTADKRSLTSHEKRLEATLTQVNVTLEEMKSAREELEKYDKLWAGQHQITMDKVRPEAEIKAELAKVEELIDKVIKRSMNLDIQRRNQDIINAANTAKDELVSVEILVSAFSPSGIISQLLGTHMRRLEELATIASRAITNQRYEITFSMADGELDVFVVSDGKKRPINTLSTSEEVWVSFIISHVVNQYIGNKILLIDEASVLDTTMQNGLEQFILSIRELYSNIFICATVPEDVPFLNNLQTELGGACRRIMLRR